VIKAKEIWGRREMQTGFWFGKMQERDHLEDLGVDERIILKLILNRMRGPGLLRIGNM